MVWELNPNLKIGNLKSSNGVKGIEKIEWQLNGHEQLRYFKITFLLHYLLQWFITTNVYFQKLKCKSTKKILGSRKPHTLEHPLEVVEQRRL